MQKLKQLAQMQAQFIRTINDGPDRLDPHMFSGDPDRILLGLKMHANTISHARLVALEETFPRTCRAMGTMDFNRISRLYCDTAQARRCSNNRIGAGFAAYLSAQNVDADHTDLARIEWAYLESYHAADAPVIMLDALAILTEAALLVQRVICHPAARLVTLNAHYFKLIAELELLAGNLAGNAAGSAAVLITRPEAQVQMLAVDMVTAALFDAACTECTLGDLLQIAAAQNTHASTLSAVLCLIRAGALCLSHPCG